ncbi:MAG: hypothetical protein IJ275_07025 [Ruminococcus sp.]|nr:hypothetical protein [Ruminococcus sp.]
MKPGKTRKIFYLIHDFIGVIFAAIIITVICLLVCSFTSANPGIVAIVGIVFFLIYLKNELPIIKIRASKAEHGFGPTSSSSETYTTTTTNSKEICRGTTYGDVAYTVRGNEVCRGTTYGDIAYTIRGNEICYGTTYGDIAYTIRDNDICRGTSYGDIAYTIRGNEVCHGTTYGDIAYTIR